MMIIMMQIILQPILFQPDKDIISPLEKTLSEQFDASSIVAANERLNPFFSGKPII